MVLRSEKVAGLFNRVGGVAWNDPILAAAEVNGHFLVIYPDRISIFSLAAGGWTEANTVMMERKDSRDPRAELVATADGGGFTAYLPERSASGAMRFRWLAHQPIVAGPFVVTRATIRGRYTRAAMQAARYR